MGKHTNHRGERMHTELFRVEYRAIVKGVELKGEYPVNAPSAKHANAMFMYFIGNIVSAHPDCPPHTEDDMVEVWTEVYSQAVLN